MKTGALPDLLARIVTQARALGKRRAAAGADLPPQQIRGFVAFRLSQRPIRARSFPDMLQARGDQPWTRP